MPISQLEQTTNAFYSSLNALDTHTMKRMAIVHRNAIKSLSVEMKRIEGIMAKDKKLGLSSGMYVLQQQRLASFVVQARAEFEKFGGAVGEVLAETQLEAVKMAENYLPQYVEALNGPAPVGYAFNRLPTAAINQMVGQLTDGSPLATLTKSFGDDAAGRLNAILANGMALGINPNRIARQMVQAASGLGIARARTIARTEMLRAYREANRRTMIANKDVVKGWRWHSALDDRSCVVCFAMHGRTFKLEASMATHPNCRCSQIPITRSWKELGFKGIPEKPLPYRATVDGETWFKGLSKAAQQRVLGKGGQLAYANDLVKLDDFVLDTYSPQWGYGRVKKSLRQVVGTDNARLLSRGVVPKSVQTNNTQLRLMLVEDNPFQRQLDFIDDLEAQGRLLAWDADQLRFNQQLGHYANPGEFQAAIEGVVEAPWKAFEDLVDEAVDKYGLDAATAQSMKDLAATAKTRVELEDVINLNKPVIDQAKTAYQVAFSDAKTAALEQMEMAKWLGHMDDTAFDSYKFTIDHPNTTLADLNNIAMNWFQTNSQSNPIAELSDLLFQQFDKGIIDKNTYDTLMQSIVADWKHYDLKQFQGFIDGAKTKLDDYAPIIDPWGDIPNEWAKVSDLYNNGKLTHTEYIDFGNALIGKPKIQAKIEIDDFVNDPKWTKVTKSSQELFDELDATFAPYAEKQNLKALYKTKSINKEQMQAAIDDAVKKYPTPPQPTLANGTQPSGGWLPSSTPLNPPFNPPDVSDLTFVKDLGGSTGARLMEDVNGTRYVLKKGANLDHLLSESRADDIYQALGIDVPPQKIVNGDTKLSMFLDGRTLDQLYGSERAAAEAVLRENFVADAFLGNWDVVGMSADNILVDYSGKVWRIDNGGALSFRAQGAKKTASQWNSVVDELETMRKGTNQASKVFGSVTDQEIINQIAALSQKRNAIYQAAAKTSIDDANMLMQRLDYLEDWAAVKKSQLNIPSVPTQQINFPAAGLLDETDSLPFLDLAEQAGYISNAEKQAFLQTIQDEGWKSIKVGTETTKFLQKKGVPPLPPTAYSNFKIPPGGFKDFTEALDAVSNARKVGIVTPDEAKNLFNNGIIDHVDTDDVKAAKLHHWLKSKGVQEGVPPQIQSVFATADEALQAVNDARYAGKITWKQAGKLRDMYYDIGKPYKTVTTDDFILAVEKRLGIKRPKALKAAKTPFKKHVDKMDNLLQQKKITQRQYDFILDNYANGKLVNKDIDALLTQYDKITGIQTGLPPGYDPTKAMKWHQLWDHDGFMGGAHYKSAYMRGRGATWFKNYRAHVTDSDHYWVKDYTSEYAEFNKWLRKHKRDPNHYNAQRYQQKVEAIERAFQNPGARSTEPVVVYRGTGLPDDHDWFKADVGDVITDTGVMSTSVGETAAFPGNVKFVAYVPQDANAIWIGPDSWHEHEREVIFKPGQQWMVHHKEIRKSGGYGRDEMTIVVEYIETP